MAAHTFNAYFAAETGIKTILKAGREVQLTLLHKPCKRSLVQVAVLIHDMRVGMMAAAYYIVYFFYAAVNRVAAFQAVFHNH